ncbi:MAG: membrane protein insertion efficiency factor YidD [Alphaproteobacteria bacterium]|jgi:putative membrane protein insertion efficiency factor|nr:membrane protein insertion efficiency factor YidD [Alphaproteobacteria bacterium]MBP9877938.1 membrane protein insertion efficiency factor YidD [Alphaproteobacteria bacterium]
MIRKAKSSPLLNRPALWLIAFYQFLLSPWVGRQCRFSPSCSHYAKAAFERYSFLKALILSIKRIARCHPFAEGGEDPLP